MGYTNYWIQKKPFNDRQWNIIKRNTITLRIILGSIMRMDMRKILLKIKQQNQMKLFLMEMKKTI